MGTKRLLPLFAFCLIVSGCLGYQVRKQSKDIAVLLFHGIENPTHYEDRFAAFPDVAFDGERYLLVYRLGRDHVGDRGQIYMQAKPPRGPWSEPVLIAADSQDLRDPALVVLGDRLLLTYFKYDPSRSKPTGVYARASTDGGRTWGPEVVVLKGDAAARGKPIQLSDGRILAPIYRREGTHYNAEVMESLDLGRTWTPLGVVAEGRDHRADYTEMALLELDDGALLAQIREDRTNLLYEAISYDGGATWSEPMPLWAGHAPILARVGPYIVSAYGKPPEPRRYTYYRISRSGRNWGAEFPIDETANGSYPSIACGPETCIVVYYLDAGGETRGGPPANIYVREFELVEVIE